MSEWGKKRKSHEGGEGAKQRWLSKRMFGFAFSEQRAASAAVFAHRPAYNI